ncbi:MAG: hypothetical protein BGO82_13485 [Devosia sp. 67-54]|nr:MAG: hypothetical protein BGO82_13485 [Devosia sp. 67-54]
MVVRKLNGTLVFSVLMVVISGVLAMSAASITTSPFDPVGARIFPLSVAAVLLVLCLVQFGLRLRDAIRPVAKAPPDQPPADAAAPGRGIFVRVGLVLVILAACTLLMQVKVIDALVAMTVAVIGSALALAPVRGAPALLRETAWAALLAAILVGTAYLLFVQTFGIRL